MHRVQPVLQTVAILRFKWRLLEVLIDCLPIFWVGVPRNKVVLRLGVFLVLLEVNFGLFIKFALLVAPIEAVRTSFISSLGNAILLELLNHEPVMGIGRAHSYKFGKTCHSNQLDHVQLVL